jgi:hypothetical protein
VIQYAAQQAAGEAAVKIQVAEDQRASAMEAQAVVLESERQLRERYTNPREGSFEQHRDAHYTALGANPATDAIAASRDLGAFVSHADSIFRLTRLKECQQSDHDYWKRVETAGQVRHRQIKNASGQYVWETYVDPNASRNGGL